MLELYFMKTIEDLIEFINGLNCILEDESLIVDNLMPQKKIPQGTINKNKGNFEIICNFLINYKSNDSKILSDDEKKSRVVYESLKSKCENELYLFDLLLLSKCVKSKNNEFSFEMSKQIKLFFEIQLSDLIQYLSNRLNQELNEDIFNEIDSFYDIINSSLIVNQIQYDKYRIIAYIYIFYILSNYKKANFQFHVQEIEAALLKLILFENNEKNTNKVIKRFYDVLISKNPKNQSQINLCHYFLEKVCFLEKENQIQAKRESEYLRKIDSLNREITELSLEISNNQELINAQKNTILEFETNIENLLNENKTISNRLLFEANRFEQNLRVQRDSLVGDISRKINFELNELLIFSGRLSPNHEQSLKVSIEEIKRVVSNL